MMVSSSYLSVFTPLVLLADLSLLLCGEVVDNVESLANLLRGLALDHGRDSSARQVKQRLDVHEVGGEDELEELSGARRRGRYGVRVSTREGGREKCARDRPFPGRSLRRRCPTARARA